MAQLRTLGARADSSTYERLLMEASQQRFKFQQKLNALKKVHSYLQPELTSGSKALHELHCFLAAQIEYIEFDELDMGRKPFRATKTAS